MSKVAIAGADGAGKAGIISIKIHRSGYLRHSVPAVALVIEAELQMIGGPHFKITEPRRRTVAQL